PAVLGSARMPSSRSIPSSPGPPEPSRMSTLRIDTVVSAVPEAISASRNTSWLPAPPVPVMSREPISSPAMTSGESSTAATCEATEGSAVAPPRAAATSATLDRRQDVHLRAGAERCVVPVRTGHDSAVDRDGHTVVGQVHRGDEGADGGAGGERAVLTVDGDDHEAS